MHRKLYVAETNEDGHIEHVWVLLEGRRSAQPFDPEADAFAANERAEFFGAERAAMKSWLAAKQVFRGREAGHSQDMLGTG